MRFNRPELSQRLAFIAEMRIEEWHLLPDPILSLKLVRLRHSCSVFDRECLYDELQKDGLKFDLYNCSVRCR